MKYYFLTFIIWAIAWPIAQQVVGRIRGAHKMKNKPRTPGNLLPLVLSQSCIIAAVILTPVAASSMLHEPMHPLLIIIGLTAATSGLALSISAQWYLGQYWTGTFGIHGVKVQHRVITRGPYRWIRHPMYTGCLVACIGLALGSWNPWYAAACISYAAAYATRAGGEEEFLRELPGQRGRNYAQYAAVTGAFFPRLLGLRRWRSLSAQPV